MSNVPVLNSVKAAWAFHRTYWREAPGALALVAATSALVGSAEYWRPGAPIMALIMAAYVAAFIVAFGAMTRLAFADEHPDDPEFDLGPGGIQWGRTEWRLTRFAALVLFLSILAALMLVFVIMLIVAASGLGAALSPGSTPEAVMEALGPGASGALAIAVLLFIGAAMFTWIRLFLAPTATVAEKQLMVFQTWPLTRGQFWRIFAANLLVTVPPAIVAGIVGVAALAAVGVPVNSDEVPTLSIAAALAVSVLPGLIEGFLIVPLTVGLGAYLYRGLRPSGQD
jgi:hypothetical protein